MRVAAISVRYCRHSPTAMTVASMKAKRLTAAMQARKNVRMRMALHGAVFESHRQ
jgi:hypothetical protein